MRVPVPARSLACPSISCADLKGANPLRVDGRVDRRAEEDVNPSGRWGGEASEPEADKPPFSAAKRGVLPVFVAVCACIARAA